MTLSGVNLSEKYLSYLCGQTFLSLWCFPNVYTDEGVKTGREGKELCDLVIVFDNNVIIFSIKHCKFKDDEELEENWKRWYKRAILKSVKQIYGAQRWIMWNPSRIFLDKKGKSPLPIALPPKSQMKVYRVAVALGARTSCQKYCGGSGSLRLNTELNIDDKDFHSHLLIMLY